uniref:Uncharacterized protein n=1 Tax=Anser cygnoides TaxID=8845 RepID=A0A8B9DNQ3_ANSCY
MRCSSVGVGRRLCATRGARRCAGRRPRTTFPSGPRGAGRKWLWEDGADSISRRPSRAAAPPPFPVGPRGGGAKMAAAGGGGPAARELFAEGLLQFLRPAVRQLDGHVHAAVPQRVLSELGAAAAAIPGVQALK